MNQPQTRTGKQKRVWSPRALVWFAILFSVFPAAIMFAVNYGRYGQPKKRTIAIVTLTVVLLVFWALDYLDPDGSKLRVIGLTLVTSWILYAKQVRPFREWRSQGGRVASVWSGLGVCLAFLASYVAVALTLSLLEPDYLAADLIDKGDFSQAEQRLYRARQDYPNDLDVRYNLAVVYSGTDRKAAALREVQAILARRPGHREAREFLLETTQVAAETNVTGQTPGGKPSTRPAAGFGTPPEQRSENGE